MWWKQRGGQGLDHEGLSKFKNCFANVDTNGRESISGSTSIPKPLLFFQSSLPWLLLSIWLLGALLSMQSGSIISLISSSITLPLVRSTQVILASLLVLRHTRHHPNVTESAVQLLVTQMPIWSKVGRKESFLYFGCWQWGWQVAGGEFSKTR